MAAAWDTSAAAAAGRREFAARTALSVVAACTYLRLVVESELLLNAASIVLVVFAITAWPTVTKQARIFAGIGLLAWAAVALFTKSGAAVMRDGFAQSTQFATLLAALATLRLPMRRSALIPRAAHWLIGSKPRRRHATVTFGSHWLSLMFMFGVVPMMGEMLRHRGLDARASASARHMMSGVIRGLALTTAWSPMAISFAIVSTALPLLSPLAFVTVGMLVAAVLLGADCARSRDDDLEAPASGATREEAGGGRALFAILAMAIGLFAGTYALYRFSCWSFLMCSAVALPCFSVAWFVATRHGDAGAPRPVAQFFAVLTETRSEAFIFSSSTFIGQAIVTGVLLMLPAGGQGGGLGLPPLAAAWLCLWSIPLVAAMSIAPTIIVLLWAQAIALSGIGAAAPLTFALAMTLGWSIAICISPVSATLLIAGSITGVPAREIALRWNLRFAVGCAAACSGFLALFYALGL